MTLRKRIPGGWRSGLAVAGLTLAAGAALPVSQAMASSSYPAVTQSRLLNAQKDSGWLMYRRDYTGRGYAPFDNINTSNVKDLKEAWSHKVDLKQGFEGAPIVNGDYMFVTTPLDHLIALNATTGKVLWTYKKHLVKRALKTVCCDVVNRGVSLYGDNVYMATLDNHVVALNARTGKVVWDKELMKPGIGYAMTVAPLTVDGKIVVGVSGGEYGARGFIEALDAKTGAKVWKRYTIPAPNQPGGKTWPKGAYKHGGGPAWLTGTYDAKTHTLFWGVGNPGPWLATLRPGKNLYTDSMLALNPDTGKIKWYYQFTPHDTWDYDGVNETILTPLTYKGKHYKALVQADRNGWFYAINRENGKLIYAKPFVRVTSVTGMDSKGQAITNNVVRPAIGKEIFTCPSFLGGKNWWPMSVDPQTQMAYVPTLHACMTMKGASVSYMAGLPYLGETFKVVAEPGHNHWGSVQAIDLNTGKQVWQHKTHAPWNGGMLSTAGGLVFSGSVEGHFVAFNARTGKIMWDSGKLSSGIVGVPTTYTVNGKQYVAVWAGWGGATPIWGGVMANDPSVKNVPRGGHLYVFALQK